MKIQRLENGNLNAPRPGYREQGKKYPPYTRLSLTGEYGAWYRPEQTQTSEHAFISYSINPSSLPGKGTKHAKEDQAREAVDHFMDHSVPAHMEQRAEHTIAPDRIEYLDGNLTIIDHSPRWNAYFPAPEIPGEQVGSVGNIEAASNGGGGYYLRRFRRHEDGSMREQRPDPEIAALLMDLVMLDIHSNYWGTKIYAHTNYEVAADISNAVFPQTWPPYESRQLRRDDEQLVLTRRGRGLVGDPVTGRPTEEERLHEQLLTHLDDKARQRDLPILYDL